MTKLITEEMVTQASLAFVAELEGCKNPRGKCPACALLAESKYHKIATRAALTAVLPDIIEECAKVAVQLESGGRSEYGNGWDDAADAIATAICHLGNKVK